MAKKKAASSNPSPTPAKKKATAKKDVPSLKPVARPSDFKGIESLIFVDASTLSDHPDNWKTHTKRQLDSLDAEFNTVGWVLPLAYNLTTGRLIDGHGRKRTDYAREKKVVPVVVGRWTPEEEDQILLHLDPIGGMFETEGGKFRALMERHKQSTADLAEQISEQHQEAIKEVNDSLEIYNESLEYGAPASFLPDYSLYADDAPTAATGTRDDPRKEAVDIEESDDSLPGMYDLKLFEELPFDCFGKGGTYDIPLLRPDMLAEIPGELQTWVGPETPEADAYFYIYGCAAIEKVRSNKLVVAYYTYDRKFESIWNDPRKFTARMINFNVHSVITPNFSVWEGAPWWFEIYQIARARWLGRYWQETGKLKVIPDVLLGNLPDDDHVKLRVAGLPKGLPCISVQVQQKGEADVEGFYARRKIALLKVLKLLEPKQLLLYHGPDLPKNWTMDLKNTQVIPVKSWMWERGKVLKDKDYLKTQ